MLPDSRCRTPIGTLMADWPLPGGGTVRIEVEPIYCCACGKPWAWVPMENTAAVTAICQRCYDADPDCFAGQAVSDEQFCRDVSYEMAARFGRDLDPAEIARATAGGVLGLALEALLRDSPYAAADHRPRRLIRA